MQITILGSGTSTGVPVIGCSCPVCNSENLKNRRSRASIFIEQNNQNFIIDTSTDFREQILRHKIIRIDAVLYTHAHADHIHGIDDLRLFNVLQKGEIPVYGDENSLKKLEKYFDYIFCDCGEGNFIPKIKPYPLKEEMNFNDLKIFSFPLLHGHSTTYGFRFGNAAYLTDLKTIPESSYQFLKNLDLLILGAIRYKPHPTHLCIPEALEEIKKIKPKKAILTHLTHDVDYALGNTELPANIELAYDGMRIEL